MVTVVFNSEDRYANNYTGLDQYDYGQVLRIQGLNLPPVVEVHFAVQETGGTSITRLGVTKDGVTDVPIPDSLLENEDTTQNYSIFAFVYVTDATSGKTEYRAKLDVKARPKPEIPGGADNPDIFHEAVEAVRESAEKAEEAQKQASEDAKKTAEDRKTIEHAVESVKDITEQVDKVEKLSKEAQEAAAQAGASAEAAETHKQAAETASSAAQEAAEKAGADKRSVEKIKEAVENLSTQVQKNKDSVDKTTQDFTLTTQQALADVNNAGQTQTKRVQTAGTTAVEDVNTAQDTATKAVETAKTEAVQAVQTEGNKQVKTVEDKAQEVLQSLPDLEAQMETKLDKQQGTENAGKALVVGEDGNVVPGKPQAEDTQDAADAIVNTATGNFLLIKDSAERKNKGFGMSGKTEQASTTGAQLVNPDEIRIGTIAGDTGGDLSLKQYITTGYIPVSSGKNMQPNTEVNFHFMLGAYMIAKNRRRLVFRICRQRFQKAHHLSGFLIRKKMVLMLQNLIWKNSKKS